MKLKIISFMVIEKMYGYVYIRETIFKDINNVIKIGISKDLIKRETTYITGEYIRGKYIMAWEVYLSEMEHIDDCLKMMLEGYNKRHISNGGTEFYDISVLDKIDDIIDSLEQYYRKLSDEELQTIKRESELRMKLHMKKKEVERKKVKDILQQQKQKIIPYDYQKNIIDKCKNYYETHNKGLLVLMCGMGKTLISLWVSQQLGCNKILVGVPNNLLLQQWQKEVKKILNVNLLIVRSGTNCNAINKFMDENDKCCVITTYHSSHKLENLQFDMKILDEVHHLTSENIDTAQERKTFVRILNVPSIKQLGLTATMKELQDFENGISNDNTEIFGNIIDEKNLLWAIERNITTDYLIQTVQVKSNVLDEIGKIRSDNDRNLMLAAYCAIESLKANNSQKMLIFCNTTENAKRVIELVQELNPDIYSSAYHSNMKNNEQEETLRNFNSNQTAIISCVYCLGEGWDFPPLDAVVFAERMTSNIRIVQSALRACRKNKDNPNKIAKIILPVLYQENWLDDNTNDDLRKVREVIYQMSMEDERIIQKIIFTELNPRGENDKNSGGNIGEINEDITQKLILKTVHRNQLGITYEKAKQIIREEKKKFRIECQKDYLELCQHNTKLNEDPKSHFGDRFTNWIDYLSLENLEQKYYDLDTAKTKIQQYIQENYDATFGYMVLAKKICEQDKRFPPIDLWTSFYRIDDIDTIFIDNSIPESIF